MKAFADKGFWLVVEDNEDDFFLFRRACSAALGNLPSIHWEKDGAAAMTFLQGSSAAPDLIISDLQMPEMNGIALLNWARTQDSLKRVRFIILSNSASQKDIAACHEHGVDEYRIKPSTLHQLTEIIKEIGTGLGAA